MGLKYEVMFQSTLLLQSKFGSKISDRPQLTTKKFKELKSSLTRANKVGTTASNIMTTGFK
jgi:hypothetical protein